MKPVRVPRVDRALPALLNAHIMMAYINSTGTFAAEKSSLTAFAFLRGVPPSRWWLQSGEHLAVTGPVHEAWQRALPGGSLGAATLATETSFRLIISVTGDRGMVNVLVCKRRPSVVPISLLEFRGRDGANLPNLKN